MTCSIFFAFQRVKIQFGYPGDPVLGVGELQPETATSESMMYTIEIGELKQGDERQFDFAIVVGQGKNHLGSVERLKTDVDFVRDFYNKDLAGCYEGIVGIPATIDPPAEPALNAMAIYPNPSNGEFVLEVEEMWIGAELNVFSVHGNVQINTTTVSDFRNNIRLNCGPGVYLLTLEKGGVSKIFKAVVE